VRSQLIVVEGIRGSGKTTLIKETLRHFPDLVYVQDMGEVGYCRKLREFLLMEDVHPMSRLAVSFAARVELQETVIKPALIAGKNVICERWYHSAEAYILYPNGIGPSVSDRAREFFNILEPDLVVIMTADFSESLKRLRSQSRELNVFEKDEGYMRKVSDFYNGYCEGLRADTQEIGLGHIESFFTGTGGD
jgi:dTMP kinase